MKLLSKLMAVCLMAFAGILSAQTNGTGEPNAPERTEVRDSIILQVNGNRIVIRASSISNMNNLDLSATVLEMVMNSKSALQSAEKDLKKIDLQLKAGTITESEAEERRQELAIRLARHLAKMAEIAASEDDVQVLRGEEEESLENANGIADSKDEDSDDWLEKWFEDDDIKIRINPGRKGKSSDSRSNWGFEVNWGLNTLVNADNTLPSGDDELKVWGSNQFDFGWYGAAPLGRNTMFSLRSGVNFSFARYALSGRSIFSQADNAVSITPFNLPVERSTLFVNYINIPLLLEFDSSKRTSANGFVFAAGGYGGIRTRTRNRYRYLDAANNVVSTRVKGNYFLNDLRYGLMAQVGYGNFRTTVHYEINPFFRAERGPEYYRIAVTVGWDIY
jgi:hypothetical protein